jgi:hypothetical protein
MPYINIELNVKNQQAVPPPPYSLFYLPTQNRSFAAFFLLGEREYALKPISGFEVQWYENVR